MESSLWFWSSVSGSLFLIAGLVLIRKDLAPPFTLDNLIALGFVFEAAPLATFGTEHLLTPHVIAKLVPSWIPAPMFWTYFVGIGLFAAALSFIVRKQVRWSAFLLGIMFIIFVLTMDAPAVISSPNERLRWSLMFRETAFAGGALALAGWARQDNVRISRALIVIGRTCVAGALIFYSIEHFVWSRNAPGVPLEKMSPAWVPAPELWSYAVGAVLLIAGLAVLFNWRTRMAAASVGALMTFLTLFLYFPILVKALGTPDAMQEVNYVFDTLFFAGTVLLVAIAAPPLRAATTARTTVEERRFSAA